MDFQDLLPKMGVWGAKWERDGAMLTPNELDFSERELMHVHVRNMSSPVCLSVCRL